MSDPIEGKTLPKLTLEATELGRVTLPDDLRGSFALIYFYPKDDTPGCTKQACAYRDSGARFRELGVKLFGVSLDDMASHEAFKNKYSLDFPLLSDPEHKLADFFGVYGEREWQGKRFMGLSRDTFLIDPDGKVVGVYRGVDPLTSVEETYKALKERIESRAS